MLWNLFLEDAAIPIRNSGFKEIVFADDLNAWRSFKGNIRNATILKHGSRCQDELHKWGRANQVTFELAKEHFSIISRVFAQGPPVKLLGLSFDTGLKMDEAVSTLANETNWKLRNLLRTRRYFDTKMLVLLFKSRTLGYVEYRTPAIYHASATSLA